MQIKRVLWMCILRGLCLSVFLLGWCGGAGAEGERARIGVITALSGDNAVIGTALKNGVEMARLDYPSQFAAVDVAYEDSQGNPQMAIASYLNLLARGPLSALVVYGPGPMHALAPRTESAMVPQLGFTSDSSTVAGKNFMVLSMGTSQQLMAAMARYLIKQEVKEVALVTTEHSFFPSMVAGLKNEVRGAVVVKELPAVGPSEFDFRSLLAKLRPYEGKFVGLFLWPSQLLQFSKQAREMKLRFRIFGTDLCESAAVIEGAGDLLDGCVYPDFNPSEEFRERYRSRFGDEAQLSFAGLAYDKAVILSTIFAKNPTLQGDGFMRALSEVRNHPGVMGEVSFRDEAGVGKYLSSPTLVKQIVSKRGQVVQ